MENKKTCWAICQDCHGRGKKSKRLRKKALRSFQKAVDEFEKLGGKGHAPIRPNASLLPCFECHGTGLVHSEKPTVADHENFPHVAIVGAGIGGTALAVACLHRGIPFTLYERDNSFSDRSQGYGLTLQQASKAIAGLGISSLEEGMISTRHVVHTTEGKIIGEWGMRKWLLTNNKPSQKRSNIHIARQSLRLALLEQLKGQDSVKWGHQLVDYKEHDKGGVDLIFEVDGKRKEVKADLLVGADGIRSSVRKLLIGDTNYPLRYLDCIVILGICPLENLEGIESALLDSETVFQTANGSERIYIMPYTAEALMWQLSFPMTENEAIELGAKGTKALKEEACRRTLWHNPIPQIMSATPETHISGYPVYDRELLSSNVLEKGKQTTLIGDAAHPMSPFKGQGANQALLDALALARSIYRNCNAYSQWRENGIRKNVLADFEREMLERTAVKVKDSAAAAQLLHSEMVLQEGNQPRGNFIKKDKKKN